MGNIAQKYLGADFVSRLVFMVIAKFFLKKMILFVNLINFI